MFLNLGGDVLIPEQDVVGVFDLDKLTVFKNNRKYLSNTEKKGKIISVAENLPKSFIVCCSGGEEKVYISPLLTATLFKRNSVDL